MMALQASSVAFRIPIVSLLLVVPGLTASARVADTWDAEYQAGWSAYRQGRFAEAEKRLIAAESIASSRPGEASSLATTLDRLAWVRLALGKEAAAIDAARRSLEIRERRTDRNDAELRESLNTNACILDALGKYAEAKPYYERLLKSAESAKGANDPSIARTLDNLATVNHLLKKEAEAEALYLRALAIREKEGDPGRIAPTLHNLGVLRLDQGRFDEARVLFERALQAKTKIHGDRHPEVARTLEALGSARLGAGEHREASELFDRAIAIFERTLGPDHPHVGRSHAEAAKAAKALGRQDDEDRHAERAETIRTKHAQGGKP
ncbi:MAG: tetratricopeptide repeat protein [Isosphaeraceae bacterium]|nr:tetratricopeptide repeat protein [Isosphaeraceae bacterium]